MSRILLLLPTTSWRAQALLAGARDLGLDVMVGTDRPLIWSERVPDRTITLDFARPEESARRVTELARTRPIHAVVGADDETGVLAATIAMALGQPHNPIAALQAARDKLRQRERMAGAGVPVPAFAPFAPGRPGEDMAAVARRVGFPCVVKPRRMSASRGVMRADDPAGLAEALSRLDGFLASSGPDPCGDDAGAALAEAFVPGREVALEGLIEHGRLRVLALFDKPDPMDGPFFEETLYVTPSRLAPAQQAAIASCAADAVRALGLTRGPIHAELRVNERGPWVIEVAARPIGGLCSRALRFGDGVSLETLIVMDAMGMDTAGLERETAAAGVLMLPIPGAGVLERVEGQAEAAVVPHVEQVIVTAHPGERLVPFPEGSRYPGFVFARAADPARVEAALREAHACLRFVMEPGAAGARAGVHGA